MVDKLENENSKNELRLLNLRREFELSISNSILKKNDQSTGKEAVFDFILMERSRDTY